MNWLDALLFWFFIILVMHGVRQRVLRVLLDGVAFGSGTALAALLQPLSMRFLTLFFPERWAALLAFALVAIGFGLAITLPYDTLFRHDWRLSRLWPDLARLDRVGGGMIALSLGLAAVQLLALLVLTYPVLGLDRAVRGSLFIPQIYGHLPKVAALLPVDFDAAESELYHLSARLPDEQSTGEQPSPGD